MKLIKILLLAFIIPHSVKAQDFSVTEIKFTMGLLQYRCALILPNDKTELIKMRVRYYSPEYKQTIIVEETMKFISTQNGGVQLQGYNPVFAGTQTPAHYNPDIIIMSIDENGQTVFTLTDSSGKQAKCETTEIKGYDNIENFLSDFNWKL